MTRSRRQLIAGSVNAFIGGMPSLTPRGSQLHIPDRGSFVRVSHGTNLSPPYTSEPWILQTYPTKVLWVGMSSCVTWQRWPQVHTVKRGRLGRSSSVVSIPYLMSPSCCHQHRRLLGTARQSLPTRRDPYYVPPLSWSAMF